MKKLYAVFTVFFSFVLFFNGCGEDNIVNNNVIQSVSPLTSTYDSKYAVEWTWLSCRIVADESRDNPPQAARVYSYTCIAIYQCVLAGMPLNRSLSGQVKEYPADMPYAYPDKEYDWPSVITGAMPVMFRGLFRTLHNPSNNMINSLYDRQKQERTALKDSVIINRSIAYGEAIAQKLLEWAHTDGYSNIQGLPYVPPPPTQNPLNWQPINPGDTAVEPYWGTLRTFALPNAAYNILAPSFEFDTTAGSPFYNDELEVYHYKTNATQEERNIALFWRDKQLTFQPPGHWVSILNIILKRDNVRLDKAAECYAYVGIAIGDAFIAAWYAKYFFNYLRPQTYIRRYTNDQGWIPLIPSPPFPDYPSGHSTSSGTCSYVIASILGEQSFTDTTHQRIGMQPRSFNSFYDAAVECSNSRIYGGIHYRNACENGVIMGRHIGETIMSRVRLKRF